MGVTFLDFLCLPGSSTEQSAHNSGIARQCVFWIRCYTQAKDSFMCADQ